MAKVHAQVLGGPIQDKEADTVGGLKKQLGVPGHTANVNGEPADDGYELNDFEFVAFAPAVKGGI